MISVFLGAGFSFVGGFPLASQLFDEQVEVDRITRQRLVERVLRGWSNWKGKEGGTPEEYLAFLEKNSGREWVDALWYVGLVIALKTGSLEYVGTNLTITRHNIDRTTGIVIHEAFWTEIFKHTSDIAVITTNYDILAERGLRHEPRPRVPRPGFHYGDGPENLAGGGYPSYSHIQKIAVTGKIPLLKLHGSVSWSYRRDQLIHYHDCRPAIRGDATIVAPVTRKTVPHYLHSVWEKAETVLSASTTWIVVGYSFPPYDIAVRNLLACSVRHGLEVHIFDQDESVGDRVAAQLPVTAVSQHPGLPQGLEDLSDVITKAS